MLKRPSPAMVVAVIALVAAMTGSGVAGEIAGVSSLDRREKKQVRKLAKKVANARITARASRLTVARARNADRAATADSATTANSAGTAGTADRLSSLLWAVVNADGSLARSSAGIVSAAPSGGAGNYIVVADRDVSRCAYQVSIEGNDPGDTDNGETSANPESGSPNAASTVRVGTFSPAGAPVNEGFMLLITC